MLPIRKLNTIIYSPVSNIPQIVGRDPVSMKPIFATVATGDREQLKASLAHISDPTKIAEGVNQESFGVEGRIDTIPNWLVSGGTYEVDWGIGLKQVRALFYLAIIGESVFGLEKQLGIHIEGTIKIVKK